MHKYTKINSTIIHYYSCLVIQSKVKLTHTETQYPCTHSYLHAHTHTHMCARTITPPHTHRHTHTQTHTHRQVVQHTWIARMDSPPTPIPTQLIITTMIISKVQILKKPSALYKEHDGSGGAG